MEKLESFRNTIIAPESAKILIRVSTHKKFRKSRISELAGLLREYKNKHCSLELQEKSRDWY